MVEVNMVMLIRLEGQEGFRLDEVTTGKATDSSLKAPRAKDVEQVVKLTKPFCLKMGGIILKEWLLP